MKKIFLLLLFAFMFMGNSVSTQELLQYSQKEEYLLVFPDGQVFGQELWPVNFQRGTNQFLWQRTEGEELENVSWKVQGGMLKNITHELNSLTSYLSIEADKDGQGEIILLYPREDIESQFIYQINWEKGNTYPQVLLWVTIKELGSYSSPGVKLKILGREFTLDLEPQRERRLLLVSTAPEEAEKVIKYHSKEDAAKLFWRLKLPYHLLLPAKVECFEKEGQAVTFLGEGTFYPSEVEYLELPLGEVQDIILKETIVYQEKVNQVRDSAGKEVLYDTKEEKLYHLQNRGEEVKKVIVYDRVFPSLEIISSSLPAELEEADLLSFEIILSPQEEKEIRISVQGKKLTKGWIWN